MWIAHSSPSVFGYLHWWKRYVDLVACHYVISKYATRENTGSSRCFFEQPTHAAGEVQACPKTVLKVTTLSSGEASLAGLKNAEGEWLWWIGFSNLTVQLELLI